MYLIIILSVFYGVAKSANYDRYDSGAYSTLSPYSTVANLYNQYPYKTASYANDVANFPEVTRYPNFNTGYTTAAYNTYTTPRSSFQLPDTQRKSYSRGYSQGHGQGYSAYEVPFMGGMGEYCVDRTPQHSIAMENLIGIWYGVEFVEHLAGDSRVHFTKTCIVIHISEPKDKPSTVNQVFHVQHINARFLQENRHLRLLWDEAGLTTEYSLYFKNVSAGYWQSFDKQNGTMPAQEKYQQFSGTIQVLKVVQDHLVLNFCQEGTAGRPAQLYTVLFSREPSRMERRDIDSVHTMLQIKKLSVASRRMVCGNSANKAVYSLVGTIILYLLTCVIGS